jgi:hypothetical protein
MLVMRGYKPKDAVELLLQQTVIECGNDPRMMEKARADAEDFQSMPNVFKCSQALLV